MLIPSDFKYNENCFHLKSRLQCQPSLTSHKMHCFELRIQQQFGKRFGVTHVPKDKAKKELNLDL